MGAMLLLHILRLLRYPTRQQHSVRVNKIAVIRVLATVWLKGQVTAWLDVPHDTLSVLYMSTSQWCYRGLSDIEPGRTLVIHD